MPLIIASPPTCNFADAEATLIPKFPFANNIAFPPLVSKFKFPESACKVILDPLRIEDVDDEYDEIVDPLFSSIAAFECKRVNVLDVISAVESPLMVIEPALLTSTFAFFDSKSILFFD